MNRRLRAARRGGFTLIEVVAALAIFGFAVVAYLAVSAASSRAVTFADAFERRVVVADALLATVSLWPREDLDRHLGERPEGPFVLEIKRQTLNLYKATVRDSGAAGRILLATDLYRRAIR